MRHLSCFVTVFALACGGSEKPVENNDRKAGGGDTGDGQIELGDRSRTTHITRMPTMDDDDDDDDEPGVEVKGLKGRLESYDIQAGVEPHFADLTQCYASKIKRRRYLGGDITFKFTVAISGAVKEVHLEKSDLGAWDVEKCMLGIARTMTFAKPKGGEAEFTLPLEFDATRAVSWLDEDAGVAQVRELKRELKSCAKEAKTRTPRGLMITLYVAARGQVTSVGFASKAKRAMSDAWADCAEQKIRAWVLIDPLGKVAKLAFKWN